MCVRILLAHVCVHRRYALCLWRSKEGIRLAMISGHWDQKLELLMILSQYVDEGS